MGDWACHFAKIPEVTQSCYGNSAYQYAGNYNPNDDEQDERNAGLVGTINNSCIGESACYDTGGGFYGLVGTISNSCIGLLSCSRAGTFYGSVGDISNSCYGQASCVSAGSLYGSVGNINKLCAGFRACSSLGNGCIGDYCPGTGPVFSNLNSCCNTVYGCCMKNEASLPSDCKVKGLGA